MKRQYFYDLVTHSEGQKQQGEELLLSFQGEDSEFCRFNHGKVRQMGRVLHDRLLIRLLKEGRHAALELTLAGEAREDQARVQRSIAQLRSMLPYLPVDPYFLQNVNPVSSDREKQDQLPKLEEWTQSIRQSAQELDVVGIYAAGGIFRGFANSRGQRNWYENYSFNLDWSVYFQDDKAVKANYAGFTWDAGVLARKMEACRQQLAHLKKPAVTIKPGVYRVYLTPMALSEVMSLLEWRAFGLKAQRTKASALKKLVEGEQQLSKQIHLVEDVAGGVAPDFDIFGFTKPSLVPLIQAGKHAGALVSARSSREYEVPPTGAQEGESPESLLMHPGTLAEQNILSELQEGLYISNLWYMNFSDAEACRMTGMTRFATFWVKNGQIQGPVNVMRFDESLFRMLGDQLVGLTDHCELLLSSSTYDSRSTHSMRLPGALIEGFTFTL